VFQDVALYWVYTIFTKMNTRGKNPSEEALLKRGYDKNGAPTHL